VSNPVAVLGLGVASAIAAGYRHSCAVLASGTVECWGDNGNGELGNGSTATDSVSSVSFDELLVGYPSALLRFGRDIGEEVVAEDSMVKNHRAESDEVHDRLRRQESVDIFETHDQLAQGRRVSPARRRCTRSGKRGSHHEELVDDAHQPAAGVTVASRVPSSDGVLTSSHRLSMIGLEEPTS
jgi:Regulator of chromosome condensation (RCC1) repeat